MNQQDRNHLRALCDFAEKNRRPPSRLGFGVEPSWAALLAKGDEVLGMEAFHGGDAEDAVSLLAKKFSAEGCTLYLTLEPKAGFYRMPPVTESVRRLGVKRAVLGSLSPSPKERGEGAGTLRRMGLEVVLADGEEALLAQQLLEDFEKWQRKGIAVLRARVKLQKDPAGVFELKLDEGISEGVDAIISSAGQTCASTSSWQVVLDSQGKESVGDRKLVYRAVGGSPRVRQFQVRAGEIDLGHLLRDLAGQGILTAELAPDPVLFGRALRSGLLDSVRCPLANNSLQEISASSGKISLDGKEVSLRLDGVHLLPNQNLEARVGLC